MSLLEPTPELHERQDKDYLGLTNITLEREALKALTDGTRPEKLDGIDFTGARGRDYVIGNYYLRNVILTDLRVEYATELAAESKIVPISKLELSWVVAA